MEKVVTIQKHKTGNPRIEEEKINFNKLVLDAEFTDPEKMNEIAIALLNGEFIEIAGYTYFVLGVECLDDEY